MKKAAWILMVLIAVSAVGCAKKTASEQMEADLKKASDQMKKDVKNF